MNLTELREFQTEFEIIRKEYQKGFKEIDSLRRKFVSDFPVTKIKQLELDEYVIGKGMATSFCNRIENELNPWGNIHGSNARKFGLYFGTFGKDEERKYRIGKKAFGTDYKKALDLILLRIVELIENKNDFGTIKSNSISPMLKGKILSVYYPNEFLNIFSATHLNHFINALSLNNLSKSEIDKQALLLHFKNRDKVMKTWSIYEFSKFLYFAFNSPSEDVKDKDFPKELKEYKLKDFPTIETLKYDFVELSTLEMDSPESSKNPKRKNRKVDYPTRSRNYKKIGDRGEQIVLRAEKQYLEKNDKKDLSELIDHISTTDDGAGYDILSYDLSGMKKPIEVKSTLKGIGKSKIYLTANELKVSQEESNYHFYIVYDVGSKIPKIWRIKASDLIENKNVMKEPVLYELNMITE